MKIEKYLNEKGFKTKIYDPLVDEPIKKVFLNYTTTVNYYFVKHKILIKELDGINYINWEELRYFSLFACTILNDDKFFKNLLWRYDLPRISIVLGTRPEGLNCSIN